MNQWKIFGLTLLLCLGLTLPVQAAALTDMSGHWAIGDIQKLVANGAISGYPDGTFRPDGTITRAEFATILCKGLGLPESTANSGFTDLNQHWANKTIQTLVTNQIIFPAEYGSKFRPNQEITRREIAIMLVRAMGLNEAAINRANEPTGFADDKQINPYDAGYILLAKEQNLIGGYEDNTFRPNNHATRAEASVIMVRFLGLSNNNSSNNTNPGGTTTPPGTQPETPPVTVPAGTYSANKNNVSFQINNVNSSRSSNNLGEQYLDLTFDLQINNQSSAVLQSTNHNMKITTIYNNYNNGQALAKVDSYSDTIPAQSSKTRTVTAHILLPTNKVAQMTLGTQITGFQISFADQRIDTADITTTVNSIDHTVRFDDFVSACLQLMR